MRRGDLGKSSARAHIFGARIAQPQQTHDAITHNGPLNTWAWSDQQKQGVA